MPDSPASEDPQASGTPDPAQIAGLASHALSADESLAALMAGSGGLTSEEAAARRRIFGENRLPKPKRPGLGLVYLRQFANPLVYLLLAATVVSIVVGELADAVFIFVVLQFNAAIGTYQERRAESEAEALDRLIRNVIVVLRDGGRRKLDASELVPGDVIELDSGTRVPADLRLIASRELTLDESLLTGESTPVAKDHATRLPADTPVAERRNMLLAGTTVRAGRATGVVMATGLATEIGRIAEALTASEGAPPPLVQRLARFSRRIGIATVILIGAIAVAQIAQGVPLLTVFLVAVALAVAAIPEGLPVAITVALAIATNRMARRHVIVRALPAVEGLGACTMIASDKTGTLTCNKLTITRALPFAGGAALAMAEIVGSDQGTDGQVICDGRGAPAPVRRAVERLAETAVLCSEASIDFAAGGEQVGDTVDLAFLTLAAKLDLAPQLLRQAAPVVGAIPYEPRRRFAAVFIEGGDKAATAHVKGAAEAVLPMCAGLDRDAVQDQANRLAGAGYRVLAVARGAVARSITESGSDKDLRNLELLGFVGLIDPIRPEASDALQACRRAGIVVAMITGDHPDTALAIARELGLADDAAEVTTGSTLAKAEEDRDKFDRIVAKSRIFARVDPLQKLGIVQAMQRNGHVVAVTGDGVNDAPALDAADLGVAMGKGGTDVARGAADLILTDDNFASIVAGVEEGRIAYANVRKVINLLITTGISEIVLFLLAIIAGLPIPLFAVQLLWLNLVTNGIQHVALTFERGEPDILSRPPRPPDQRLFDRTMLTQVLTMGGYMGLAAFAFYAWCLDHGFSEPQARNLLLLLMVLFENIQALNARSENRSVFRVPLAANPLLIFAVLAAQGLHIATMYLPAIGEIIGSRPISLADWGLVATIALSALLVAELRKRLLLRRP